VFQNVLKLTNEHLSFKMFSRMLYPRTPVIERGEGRKGRGGEERAGQGREEETGKTEGCVMAVGGWMPLVEITSDYKSDLYALHAHVQWRINRKKPTT